MFRLAEETIFQRASERNSRFCRNLLKVGVLGAIRKLMLALNLRYGANTPSPLIKFLIQNSLETHYPGQEFPR